jgi:hypothetical protein
MQAKTAGRCEAMADPAAAHLRRDAYIYLLPELRDVAAAQRPG